MVPINIARLELRSGRVATIWHADRATDTKAALRKVDAITHIAANAVIFAPLDEVGRDSALHDEVFNQIADLVVDKCGHHAGIVTETLSEPARGIVFSAALPRFERTSRADTTFTRIETEHDLAERDLVKLAFSFGT